MAEKSVAVNDAILDALAGMTAPNPTGGSAVEVGVYDFIPENAAHPFVTIVGHTIDQSEDTLDGHLSGYSVNLAVWSEYRGQRQVLAILDGIYERLHDVLLDLDTGQALLCRVPTRSSLRESDAITYQGSATIAVTVAP